MKVDCSYRNSDPTLKTVIKSIETEEDLMVIYNKMKNIFDNSLSSAGILICIFPP